MEETYVRTRRNRLNKTVTISKPIELNGITGTASMNKRKGYQQPYRKVSTPVQLARPAAINDAAPFSLPIRNIGTNLNADMKSLKFTPRSGNLPRIVGVESGDTLSEPMAVPETISQPSQQEQSPPVKAELKGGEPSMKVMKMDIAETTSPTSMKSSESSDGKSRSNESKEQDAIHAAEQAYTDTDKRSDIQGYNAAKSNKTTLVIDRDDERIIGIRGTASKMDVVTDASIVVGRLQKTSRYKEDYQNIRKLVYEALNEGKKVVLSGHSLGGSLASKITETLINEDPRLENVLKTYTFNEGTSPLAKDKCKGRGCDNIERQRIKGDVISAGGDNKYQAKAGKCSSSASAHGINQFSGSNCTSKSQSRVKKGIRLAEKTLATSAQLIKQSKRY